MKKFLSYKSRSLWKGFFLNRNFISIYDFRRNNIITKQYINKNINIYNGRFFIKFFVLKKFIGYKAGQFILTKKIGRQIHLKLNSKNNKLKKK